MNIENTLYVHLLAERSSFYSPHAGGFQRDLILDATQGRLYRIGKNGEKLPELLSHWECSKGGKIWTLELAPTLTFHNGRAVDPTDLEFSLLAGGLSRFGVPETSVTHQIKQAKEITPGSEFRSGMCSGIKVLDSRRLRVELIEANPGFLDDLACGPSYSPLPRECLKPLGVDLKSSSPSSGSHLSWKEFPVGAGPYQFESASKDGSSAHLVLVGPGSNKMSKRLASRIIISSGEERPDVVDIIIGGSRKSNFQGLNFQELDITSSVCGIYFNFDSDINRDLRFRKAVQLALDPHELADIYEEKVNDNFIPRTWKYWQLLGHKKDLAKARKLIEQLRSEYNIDELSLCLFRTNTENEDDFSKGQKAVLESLRSIGLKLNRFDDIYNADLTICGFCPSITTFHKLFGVFREGVAWVSKLNKADTVYEGLLDDLLVNSLDEGRSKEIIQKLSERFFDQAYAVPLYERLVSYWVNTDKVHSLGENWQDLSLSYLPIQLKS